MKALRPFALLSFLAAAGISAAQTTALGTKPDITSAPAAGGALVGPMEIVQLLAALGLVGALLKWGLPWIISKSRNGKTGKGLVRVEESVPVGPGQLHVVEVEGRRLLVGSTAQTISLISELNIPHITIQQPGFASEQIDDAPAFFEMVDERLQEPEPAPEPKAKRQVVKGKAAVVKEVVPDDDEGGLDFEQALALITSAKRRSGIAEASPSAAAEAAPAAKPAKAKTVKHKPAATQELTEEEIHAALERIKTLTR